MATAVPILLETDNDPTNSGAGGTYTTASITPLANQALAVMVGTHVIGGTSAAPTLTGNSLTYVHVGTETGLGNREYHLYRAMGTAPTAGQITITMAGSDNSANGHWCVLTLPNVDTGGTNGSAAFKATQSNFATTGTTQSADVGSPDTENAEISFTGILAAVAVTPVADYIEISENQMSGAGADIGTIQSQYDLTAPSDGVADTTTAASQQWAVWAIEVLRPLLTDLLRWLETVAETAAYAEADTGGWGEAVTLDTGEVAKVDSDTLPWAERVDEIEPATTPAPLAWADAVSETATAAPTDAGGWADGDPGPDIDPGADPGGFGDAVSQTAAASPADTLGWDDATSLEPTTPADPLSWDDATAISATAAPADTLGWADAGDGPDIDPGADPAGWAQQTVETAALGPVVDPLGWLEAVSLSTGGAVTNFNVSDTLRWLEVVAQAAAYTEADPLAWLDAVTQASSYAETDTGGWLDASIKGVEQTDPGAWADLTAQTGTYTETDAPGWAAAIAEAVAVAPADTLTWGETVSLTSSTDAVFGGALYGRANVLPRLDGVGALAGHLSAGATLAARLDAGTRTVPSGG